MSRTSFTVTDAFARELSSRGDEVLRAVALAASCKVYLRGDELMLDGDDDQIKHAQAVLSELRDVVDGGQALETQTVEAVTGVLAANGSAKEVLGDVVWRYRNTTIQPRTVNQKRYVDAIRSTTMTFGCGPAGTGKTYLAMALAVAALESRQVSRIVLTRPAVEAGERLGFLPGDLMAKVDPYLRPLFDALYDMMDGERVTAMLERGVVEVAPLAFMRGRTLNDAFIILDEAQNTTREQMRMFLTRLGFGSRAVITGDPTQIDLPRDQMSGLNEARQVLAGVSGIEIIEFERADVVRHKLVQSIVEAYRISDEARDA
ncbi:MAG: PhoH family protein [Thermoleophilia bacterium]|nr:PhoH family protein [Thermoleophilia bacterium]